MTRIYTYKNKVKTLLLQHHWPFEFLVVFQVIVQDVLVVLQAGLHRLQDKGEAPVQGSEVGLGQERGDSRQRVLGEGLSHDVTQAEAGGGQEVQSQVGGLADPVRVIVETSVPSIALLLFPSL